MPCASIKAFFWDQSYLTKLITEENQFKPVRTWSKKRVSAEKVIIWNVYNQIVYSVKFAYFAGKTSTKLSWKLSIIMLLVATVASLTTRTSTYITQWNIWAIFLTFFLKKIIASTYIKPLWKKSSNKKKLNNRVENAFIDFGQYIY